MYIKRKSLLVLIDLVKANPEIDTDKLLALVEEDEPETKADPEPEIYPEPEQEELIADDYRPDPDKLYMRDPNRVAKRSKRGKRWSSGDDEALVKMHEEGLPIKDVAEKLGRTVKAISLRKKVLSDEDKLEPKKRYRHYTYSEMYSIKSLFYDYERVTDIPDEEILRLANELDRTTAAIKTQLYAAEKESKKIKIRGEK